MVTIIVAIAENYAIGRKGELLWHLPADLRHFKEKTLNSPVIMGRKTWESLPKRPLPKRLNIVVTRAEDYSAPGASVCHSLFEAIELARINVFDNSSDAPEKDIFIIGGGELYKQAMEVADRLEITHIKERVEDADTFFPEIKDTDWKLEEETFPEIRDCESNAPEFSFRRYERKNRPQ